MKNLLIRGNHKLGFKRVAVFNLPARETCTPTSWCLTGNKGKPACYGLRNRYTWEQNTKAAQERFIASQQEDFVERISAELQKASDIEYVRVHSTGDFYSDQYIEKWIQIAQLNLDVRFKTNTRRRDLENILELVSPNFIVRESLDPDRPTPVLGLPFAAIDTLPIVNETDSYRCIGTCQEDDFYCFDNAVNVHFAQS